MAEASDVVGLLADLASIGPFFAVATGVRAAGEGWVPVRALGDAEGPLGDRIDAVAAALDTDGRTAASIAFQGIAAQLVAPLFAAVAVHGVLPAGADGLAGTLHWRPGGAGPWLWWRGGSVGCPPPDALAGVLVRLLQPVVDATRRRVAVAERVLWGNVASSVASARRLVVEARPHAAVRAAAVAGQLLRTPPLAATTILRDPEPPDVGWTFLRRSCCLYYRVPGGGTCGDCVLRLRRASQPYR